jgi:transposase
MQLQIKTLLNHVHPLKGFVYEDVRLVGDGVLPHIDATIVPRANSKAQCSKCMRPLPGYDHLPVRRFEFVPLWAIAVFLVVSPRRVDCPEHGVVVEHMPWSDGKSPLTIALMCFLAAWAKRLSWWETAKVFGSTWDKVRVSVQWVVQWGLEHRDLEGIQAIGIDEIAYRKGHKYMSLVYDIGAGSKRLLWIGEERTKASIKQFFSWFGPERCARIRYVCSDMWRPYLDAIRRFLPNALNVLDRFHIVRKLKEAIDQTRRAEAAELRRKGDKITLHKARWPLLKKVKNLYYNQFVRLQDLLKLNLRTVRVYLMVEDFDQHFWNYKSPAWAGKFLDAWCTRAMRSRIEPIKKVAKMLRSHKPLILNYFRAKKQLNSGIVEGLNNKLKLVTRKSYGFRSAETLKIALYHALGDLPTPPLAHKFA